ncbi:MAG: M15 family metallopeptidase [Candidatus Cloacimonetes bacterium]|jgi:hypothetical protein|nr:M15 family metallopeptidase [Candidatus Cloacimonadota bacterium]MDY0298526.1 M15 family metallopeptidase [Candidatus Cloacimonadaceae bacterium]MCK9331984.1 M15 family metallopeptidase [Candidatus Cloacimonadota bacterium]MDD2209727.1 M15 family metallopeptidase [Candidatus Cloacimonadota bacterium]MDD3282183.1 M15 family metallopeptidase [Candidatus Cloacimonadota bacterium]
MPKRIYPNNPKIICLLLMFLLLGIGRFAEYDADMINPSFSQSCQRISTPKDLLLGKFDPAEHPDFERISNYNMYANMYLHTQAKCALDSLVEAAAKDGITLRILSATRTFNTQKLIWERKINKYSKGRFDWLTNAQQRDIVQNILTYSAMPSTSRHHWGTDVDFCSVSLAFWQSAKGKRTYRWLKDNAENYGFALTYTQSRNGGHNFEPWHWSYLPLSDIFLDDYLNTITYSDIISFSGASFAAELGIFDHYVANVFNPSIP